MKCVICHSEDVVLAQVNEEVKNGNNIVYIPVKILRCNSCGEKYYDRKTMLYLEHATNKIRHNKQHLKQIGKIMVLEQ